MSVYLKHVTVKNYGGIEKFEAEFGDVAILVGTNGKGKSSLLNTVRSMFEGGADTTLIRAGTKKAEAEFILGNGYRSVKSIQPTKATLDVFDKNGGKIASPATKLAAFVPKDTFSVQELLQADPKDLTALMLKYLPMTFSVEEVNTAVRSPRVSKPLALSEFNALSKSVYDERTELNRSMRDLEGSISNWEANLPKEEDRDWSKERDRLDGEIANVLQDVAALKSKLEDDARTVLTESKKAHQARLDAIAKEIQTLEKEASGIRLTMTENEGAMARTVANLFASERGSLDEKHKSLLEERGGVSANADKQQQAVGIRNSIETDTARLKGYASKETVLSGILEDMGALKALKLKSLPVDGLDIVMDGKNPTILIDGIPLERLNSQRQLYVLVQFIAEAQEGAGSEFKLIVCEGSEFVPSKLIALAESCIKAGVQLIVTYPLEDEPLAVFDLDGFKTLIARKESEKKAARK